MNIIDVEPGPSCDVYPARYNQQFDHLIVSAPLMLPPAELIRWLESQEDDMPEAAVVGRMVGQTPPYVDELIQQLRGLGLTVRFRDAAAFWGGGPDAVEQRIRSALEV